MANISLSLSCPKCGGSLSVEEGSRSTACPYCSSVLWIEDGENTGSVAFRSELDDQKVRTVVHSWFNRGLKARDLDRVGAFGEVHQIYVPFWRLRALAAGWVCGYTEYTTTDAKGRTNTRREYMERMVLREYTWTSISCDAGDLGVSRLENTEGAASPLNGNIPTLEVTTSPDDARKRGIEQVFEWAVKSARVPHVTFRKIHVVPEQLTLVYYPIWVARYSYRERGYFATVDGVTGRVLAGRAPGDPLFQSLVLTGGSLAGGLLLGTGTYFGAIAPLASESTSALLIPLLVVAASISIFYGTYRFFRHGSEILEGDLKGQGGLRELQGFVEDILQIPGVRL